MKYAYSFNEEDYHGPHDTIEDALAEAWSDSDEDHTHCWIGECAIPDAASHLDYDAVIEHITNMEDFSHEWADDWPKTTKEQREELTASLQAAFKAWLDKHDLHPKFFTVKNAKRMEIPKS